MQPLKYNINPFETIGDWEIHEPFQQKVKISGIEIFLCGLQASHPKYGEVVGSAANLGKFPQNHAWFELLERITILESMNCNVFPVKDSLSGNVLAQAQNHEVFPQNSKLDERHGVDFQYSKSNGIALHTSWRDACRHACYELVERHLVLLSWAGVTCPIVLKENFDTSPLTKLGEIYDIIRVDFGSQQTSCFMGPIFVSGLVLLPNKSDIPLIVAFGAGSSPAESLAKAEMETLQRLGFLWGEEIPTKEPPFAPNALYHQEYYLLAEQRPKIEAWLAGKHLSYQNNSHSKPSQLKVRFVDISFFDSLGFKVAKALAPEATPLVFGKWRQGIFASLPEDLIIHPIA